MATSEELLDAVDEVVSDGARRGLLHRFVEDAALDGPVCRWAFVRATETFNADVLAQLAGTVAGA